MLDPKLKTSKQKTFNLLYSLLRETDVVLGKQAAEEYSSLHNQYIFKAAAIRDDAACSETIPLKYKYNRKYKQYMF